VMSAAVLDTMRPEDIRGLKYFRVLLGAIGGVPVDVSSRLYRRPRLKIWIPDGAVGSGPPDGRGARAPSILWAVGSRSSGSKPGCCSSTWTRQQEAVIESQKCARRMGALAAWSTRASRLSPGQRPLEESGRVGPAGSSVSRSAGRRRAPARPAWPAAADRSARRRASV
jgi:hypothetical protein